MAAGAGAHTRQHRLDHVDGAEVVHVEQLSHLGVLPLLHRGQVAVAGIVHENINPAERRVGRRDGRRDLAGVGDVEVDGHGPVAELLGEIPHRLGAPGGDHHVVAVLKCGAGDLTTEAGGAPGDQPTCHLRPSLPAGAADRLRGGR